MKIMQRSCLKIVVSIITLMLSSFEPSSAQTSGYRLTIADSLFRTRRYTQSLEHYEEILRQKQFTPAMLLRMAYVHEGLNQTGPAMYYLNLYHVATGDKSVLNKMDELATKFDLEGYETTDFDRFWTFYLDNHLNLSLALAAMLILMISFAYHSRFRLHKRPIASVIAVVVLCILLAVHQYHGSSRSRAIIADESTYLMDGPSAAASVIDVVRDGHRVEVLGKKDVWMKIKWDEEVVYVKENAVRQITL